MKKLAFSLCLIFLLTLSGLSAEPEGSRLRIGSWNVLHVTGLDGVLDYDRDAETIRAMNCDVLGLQELDRKTGRVNNADQIQELSQRTGLVPGFARAIDFSGGEYGIGMLSRQEPVSIISVPLPGKEEPRVLLIAEFEDFFFFNTHLSLTAESRAEAAEIITGEMKKRTKPVFLVGDCNLEWDEAQSLFPDDTWTVLSPDQPTFPANQPEVRIDYIFVGNATLQSDGEINDSAAQTDRPDSPVFRIISAQVVENPIASDHRPVCVEIQRVR